MRFLQLPCVASLVLPVSDAPAQEQPAQSPTPQQRVAMLKQWLQASQVQLRSYEWIETTVVSKDGEEKSRTGKRCYYGVDGVLQKVAVSTSSTESAGGPPGILIPGKIVKRLGERKKKDLTEYMQSAGELVHGYVPPDPARIQQSVNAGKFSPQMVRPGQVARLVFSDYLKAGDALSADIELPTNRLLGMHVASYVEDADDAVTLDAKSKGMTVIVENTGHRRTSGG